MKTGILVGLVFLLGVSTVQACELCESEFDFQQTIDNADLIIIGQKVEDGPYSIFSKEEFLPKDVPLRPEWIEVRIIEVLKGNPHKEIITVNSWDAVCPYEIIVDYGIYVMMLEIRITDFEKYTHGAVNRGCSEKLFKIEKDKIDFYGELISIDEFKEKLQ